MANHVRGVEAGGVEVTLDRVDQRVHRDRRVGHLGAADVAGEIHGKHIVGALKCLQHRLPDQPRA